MHDASEPSTKKRKGFGRPSDAQIWNHFERIDLPPEKAKTAKRNFDARCRHCREIFQGKPDMMKDHLSHCEHASNSDRMEADSMQISTAASSSSQPAVVSPRDVSAFSHSEQVELPNTDEVLEMFSSYFEADVSVRPVTCASK